MTTILCAWCGAEVEIDCQAVDGGLCPACEEALEQRDINGPGKPAQEECHGS